MLHTARLADADHHVTIDQQTFGETRYPYLDADGAILFEVVRHQPKRFEVVDPFGRIYPDGTIPHYVLYRLRELLAADPAETVWYVEGEKDCDRLRSEGLVATTNPGGCRHGWRDSYAEPLRGRHVIIVPDADGPGQRLAEAVAAGLRGVALSVVIVQLPIHGRDDVSDWLDRKGTIARLTELAAQARFEAAGIQGKPDKRRLILGAANLDTLQKLLLLALFERCHHDGATHRDLCRITASEAARLCSCHRVTAQRTLTGLQRLGVLRRDGADMVIVWDIVAALTAADKHC
jgi:hypothetical protein